MNALTSSSLGYIYILSNPSMPGLLKIGMTNRTPKERIKELSNTSIPKSFILEASICVDDARLCEKMSHKILKRYRVNDKREFFKIDVETALKQITPSFDKFKFTYVSPNINCKEVESYLDKKNKEKKRNQALIQFEKLLNEEELKQSKRSILAGLHIDLEKFEQELYSLKVNKQKLGEFPQKPKNLDFIGDFVFFTYLPILIIGLILSLEVLLEFSENSIWVGIVFAGLIYIRHLRKDYEKRCEPFKKVDLKIHNTEYSIRNAKENYNKDIERKNLLSINEQLNPPEELFSLSCQLNKRLPDFLSAPKKQIAITFTEANGLGSLEENNQKNHDSVQYYKSSQIIKTKSNKGVVREYSKDEIDEINVLLAEASQKNKSVNND